MKRKQRQQNINKRIKRQTTEKRAQPNLALASAQPLPLVAALSQRQMEKGGRGWGGLPRRVEDKCQGKSRLGCRALWLSKKAMPKTKLNKKLLPTDTLTERPFPPCSPYTLLPPAPSWHANIGFTICFLLSCVKNVELGVYFGAFFWRQRKEKRKKKEGVGQGRAGAGRAAQFRAGYAAQQQVARQGRQAGRPSVGQ